MSLKLIIKNLNVNKFDRNFAKELNSVNESAIVQSVLDCIVTDGSLGDSHQFDSSNIGKYI
jgi:hypothetical protein